MTLLFEQVELEPQTSLMAEKEATLDLLQYTQQVAEEELERVFQVAQVARVAEMHQLLPVLVLVMKVATRQ